MSSFIIYLSNYISRFFRKLLFPHDLSSKFNIVSVKLISLYEHFLAVQCLLFSSQKAQANELGREILSICNRETSWNFQVKVYLKQLLFFYQ